MAVSGTRARDLVDSSDRGHVVAQVKCFLRDVRRLFELELAAPLKFRDGSIGQDGSKKRHDEFSFWFVFLYGGCYVDCAHQSIIILRATWGRGPESYAAQADTGTCARPAGCESSQIANSRHENSERVDGAYWNMVVTATVFCRALALRAVGQVNDRMERGFLSPLIKKMRGAARALTPAF